MTLSACGQSIPDAYRGSFVDSKTGARLQLDSGSGSYSEVSGRKLESKTAELAFVDLRKGQSGVYMRDLPANQNIAELYWVNPDLSTKQEAGGVEWFRAEVFYFRMDKTVKDRVNIIQTVHSLEGIVSLDVPTSQWQIGWPAGSDLLQFKRVSER